MGVGCGSPMPRPLTIQAVNAHPNDFMNPCHCQCSRNISGHAFPRNTPPGSSPVSLRGPPRPQWPVCRRETGGHGNLGPCTPTICCVSDHPYTHIKSLGVSVNVCVCGCPVIPAKCRQTPPPSFVTIRCAYYRGAACVRGLVYRTFVMLCHCHPPTTRPSHPFTSTLLPRGPPTRPVLVVTSVWLLGLHDGSSRLSQQDSHGQTWPMGRMQVFVSRHVGEPSGLLSYLTPCAN